MADINKNNKAQESSNISEHVEMQFDRIKSRTPIHSHYSVKSSILVVFRTKLILYGGNNGLKNRHQMMRYLIVDLHPKVFGLLLHLESLVFVLC